MVMDGYAEDLLGKSGEQQTGNAQGREAFRAVVATTPMQGDLHL
jgi:hypothetical protein